LTKVQDIQERVVLKRSLIWQQNFERHDAHEVKLKTLIDKLEKIKLKLEKTVAKRKKV
jgi:hypothetical protein